MVVVLKSNGLRTCSYRFYEITKLVSPIHLSYRTVSVRVSTIILVVRATVILNSAIVPLHSIQDKVN